MSSLDDALKNVFQLTEKLREHAKLIVDLKRGEKPSSMTYFDGCKSLMDLQKWRHEAYTISDTTLKDLEGYKLASEASYLSLQNLLYEKEYLLKEIERCRNFDPVEMKKIDLVDENIFRKDAPKDILDSLNDLQKGSSEYAHRMQLCRLSFELQQREALKEELSSLENEKLQVQLDTTDKSSFLRELPVHTKALKQAATPIEKYFKNPLLERLDRHKDSKSLPNALYLIVCQLESFGDSFGGVKVEICSREKEVAVNQSKEASGNVNDKRKRKLAVVVDAEQPSKKPARDNTYDTNPSFVLAKLQSPNKSVDLTLKFEFFENLEIVTVEAINHPGLLANIFPNDTGQYLPYVTRDCDIAEGVPSSPSASQRRQRFPGNFNGRPFKWLQWLAGIYALTPEGPSSRPSMQQIIQGILDRVAAQEALSEQLQSLMQCPHPVPVHASAVDLFPQRASTKIEQWSEVDAAFVQEKIGDRSKDMEVPKGIPVLYAKNSTGANASGDSWTSFGKRYFHGIFQGGKARYEAIVEVFVDYPTGIPRFTLLPSNDSNLRTIESELNDFALELINEQSRFSLLSHQLRRLQMCLDVVANQADTDELERKHRGRDRRLAFRYDAASRKFVHR